MIDFSKRFVVICFLACLAVSCPNSRRGGGGAVKYLPAFEYDGGKVEFETKEKADIWFVLTNADTRTAAVPVMDLEPVLSVKSPTAAEPGLQRVDKHFPFKTPPILSEKNGGRTVLTRNSGNEKDEVGCEIDMLDEYRKFKAECKYVGNWVNVNNENDPVGRRRVVIYEETGLGKDDSHRFVPRGNDYRTIAEAFLSDGKNDLYGKLVSLFGNDIGMLDASKNYEGSESYIRSDGTITFLFCNIDNQGDPSINKGSYTGGYYWSVNCYDPNSHSLSNGRSMITLEYYMGGGKNIGDSLSTIAHEFQHLIHAQHYDSDLPRWKVGINDGLWLNEMFSSVAETYTAKYICDRINMPVPGPFYVGVGYEDPEEPDDPEETGDYTIRNAGYLEANAHDMVLSKGRGPYALDAFSYNMTEFSNGDDALYHYGRVANFGAYLLVNYGEKLFRDYMNGGVADFDGLLASINKGSGSKTKKDLLAQWGVACLLSSVNDLDPPYSFTKIENGSGWYDVNGMKVPSLNLWLYYSRDYDTSHGFHNTATKLLRPNTCNLFLVEKNATPGRKSYKLANLAPEVELSVVAVPK